MPKLSLLLLAGAAGLYAQEDKSLLTPEEYFSDWKISRQFTIAVAEKMPEEFYGFKPNPEQMSFGGQMVHIAGSLVFRFHQLTGIKTSFEMPKQVDKAACIRLLNEAYDYVLQVLPKITPEQLTRMYDVDWVGRPRVNGRQMMLNMFVHAAHHRAQCEVYLRLKGITPPAYTF
ncbi:MAG: DinB family protein [Acidobacteria bacterium]|nr:DinB family protein [Acidobacteriota bacterium]